MKDLTKGNMYKNFLIFAIPLILSSLLSQAYNTIDTAIAGKFLGQTGLAAIGATSQAITLISSLFWGFSVGFGVYIAKLFGAKEYKRIKMEIYNILLLLVCFVAVLGIAVILVHKPILSCLQVEKEIRHDAAIYFCVYIGGLFLITLNTTFVQIFTALGSSSLPLYMSVLSTILNVSGNIMSVTLLKLGVAGIALSSVISALVVNICYFIKLKSCFKAMGVDNVKPRFGLQSLRQIFGYAIPSSLQQAAMYFAALAMSPIINGLGSAATASYTVVMRIYDINAAIYQSSAKTLSNFAAQCVGAKKYEKIKKGLFAAFIQGILFCLPTILICIIFAQPINALFFPKGYTGEALDYAVRFSRVFLPFVFFNVINNLFHSFFRGIAAMRLLIVCTVLASVVRIIAGIYFSSLYGMDGVYIGWALSWIAEAVFVIAVFLLKFRTSAQIERFTKPLN